MKKKHNSSTERSFLWIYGQHAVEAALANPNRRKIKIKSVRPVPNSLAQDIPVEIVSKQTLDLLCSESAVHQGIALQALPLAPVSLESVSEKNVSKDVILILDQVTDPHNIGAILRSAAAFNASAIILADAHAPEETPALVKASCGGIEVVPLIRVSNLVRAIETLKKNGFWILGLDGKAKRSISEEKLPDKTAFVLGSEGEGLRRLTEENCDLLIKLPISKRMESLNVSNAAAIALYEFNRQKTSL